MQIMKEMVMNKKTIVYIRCCAFAYSILDLVLGGCELKLDDKEINSMVHSYFSEPEQVRFINKNSKLIKQFVNSYIDILYNKKKKNGRD